MALASTTGVAIASNVTRYSWFGGPIYGSLTADTEAKVHSDIEGTISNLRVYIGTNSMATGTVDVEIYKASGTNRTDSITTATGVKKTISVGDANGWFEDNTNTNVIAANTNFGIKITGSGDANTITYFAIQATFTPTDTSKTVSLFHDYHTTTLSAPATEYASLYSNFARTGTESAHQIKAPVAGTLKNLYCYCTVKTGNAQFNVYANVNGTNRLSITGKSTTGWHEENTPGTYSVSAGDLISFQHTNTGSSGGSRVTVIGCEFETTTGDSIWVGGTGQAAPTTSNYTNLIGADTRSTEAQKAIKPSFPCNIHDGWGYCSAFTSGSNQIALRDDGVTSSTLVIANTTASSWATDTSSDAVAANSVLSWIGTAGNSANRLGQYSVAIQDTTAATVTGKITAADAQITYTAITGKVTAADAEVTYTTIAGKVTAADAQVTYNERAGKITASDAEITYTPVTGQITASDAEVTYTPIAGQITAADAEVTYNERAGKITAADAEVTYDERAGKITAADAEVTYDERGAKITASDAEVTYTPVTAQVTAADAEVTYTAIAAKITAADAQITYSETGVPTGTITAADAEITYTTVVGQITAADAEVTYTPVTAKITASDAEITFDERGAKITAADAEITYTPVTGKITAVDAEVTHDTVVAKVSAADLEITFDERAGKITAADAEITYNERSGKISAVDAEITYDTVAGGPEAKITAVDIQITYTTTGGPGWNWDAVRKVPEVWSAPAFPYGIVLQPAPNKPITSQSQIRIGGTMSKWHGRNPFSRPGTTWDPLPIAALVYYVYNVNDFTDLSTTYLESNDFLKGYGYDTMKQILTARILARGGNPAAEIVENGNSVKLWGEAVIDYCSMMDIVFLGHQIPGYHAQQIKARSTAPNGTKLFLWSNFEDINQSGEWPLVHASTYILGTYPLASVGGLNAYGCTIIDQFEASYWNPDIVGCPHTPKHAGLQWFAPVYGGHTMAVDIHAATGNSVFTSAQTQTLIAAYHYAMAQQGRYDSGWKIDGLMLDTCMARPLKGTSSLNFEATWTRERYNGAWKALFDGWHHWNSSMTNPFPSSEEAIWANMDDDALLEYSAARCRNRFLEWSFTAEGTRPKTKAEIYADLTRMRDTGEHRVMALGDGNDIGNITSWATTTGSINPSLYGNWVDVATWAKTLGLTNKLYCQALRVNSLSYMTLQDVFRRPT